MPPWAPAQPIHSPATQVIGTRGSSMDERNSKAYKLTVEPFNASRKRSSQHQSTEFVGWTNTQKVTMFELSKMVIIFVRSRF